MNEAEAAATILEDVANSQVIMMEVLILRRCQYRAHPPHGSVRRKGDRG